MVRNLLHSYVFVFRICILIYSFYTLYFFTFQLDNGNNVAPKRRSPFFKNVLFLMYFKNLLAFNFLIK